MKVLHKDNIAGMVDGETVLVHNPGTRDLIGCTISVSEDDGLVHLTTKDSRLVEYRALIAEDYQAHVGKYSEYVRHLRRVSDGHASFTVWAMARLLESGEYTFK